MTIRIIDYGSGNLHSVHKAFALMAQKHGLRAELTDDAASLASASHIVLPGVGAFGDCVAGLKALDGMWDALHEAVIAHKTPFFGICVGMQMMLSRGLEHGEHAGLDWIKGEVVSLSDDDAAPIAQARPSRSTAPAAHTLAKDMNNCQEPAKADDPFDRARSERQIVGDNLKIPHMGWNTLTLTQPHTVLRDLGDDPHVYFVHSYHAHCAKAPDVLATTDYGSPITACIGRDNLIGTQFHPEKSGETGLRMIEQFIQWDGRA
jgi:glutamine amidotransferase